MQANIIEWGEPHIQWPLHKEYAIYLSVYLSIYLWGYLSIYLSIYLIFTYIYIYLFIYLFIYNMYHLPMGKHKIGCQDVWQ